MNVKTDLESTYIQEMDSKGWIQKKKKTVMMEIHKKAIPAEDNTIEQQGSKLKLEILNY